MEYQYSALHPIVQVNVLLAYEVFTRGRKELKHIGVLDQLWAMAAGLT